MCEAQWVRGATQGMRILTGSALCAALAPKSAAAATLANINLDRRMRVLLGGGVCGVRPILTPRCRAAAVLARVEIGARSAKTRQWLPAHRYRSAASSTLPMVSPPSRPLTGAATASTVADLPKTDGGRPASIIPTTVGPMIEANRSQAVATPTASARTRVG